MLSLVVAILAVSGGVLAKVPGLLDPDTYRIPLLVWEKESGEIVREFLNPFTFNKITVKPNDIKIYYYSKGQPNGTLIQTYDPVSSLNATDFKSTEPTTFIIPGWLNNKYSSVNVLIKNALIETRSDNVFVVDWSEVSDRSYATSRAAVQDVGRIVGNCIHRLSAFSGLNTTTLRIVGDSLGAHVAGFVGKTLKGTAGLIVGLDPAFPLFAYSKPDERLNPDDAKFVQVIHTDGNRYGFPYSMGHADYFPNGGESQPGCFQIQNVICAHMRASKYFAESIATENFVATKCDSYKDYKKGKCVNKAKSNMGGYEADKTAYGDYYLDTNNEQPFAKGG